MIYEKKCLSLELAMKMADAAEMKAREMGLKVVISIIDDGGNLKYFRRMDGSATGSVQVSQMKAKTSAAFPVSTKAFAERNLKYPGGPYSGGAIPDIVLLEGGMPIFSKNKEHLGGIGISGATAEEDGVIAKAALAAVEAHL